MRIINKVKLKVSRFFNYWWAKAFYTEITVKFGGNLFEKGDVVHSCYKGGWRNVISGYKEDEFGFTYKIFMKPDQSLIKKLYIRIMNFVRHIRRFIY